jgi:signal transduction histidine kinase
LIYAFYRYRLGKLVELERVRTRIATDLHDDIGANLTRIALMSEVANQQATFDLGNGEKHPLMSSIADIARESVASMNDIVWAISPEHDSLIDLTRRMRRHAEEVFTLRDIDLDFRAPLADGELRLSVGIRRDLLLIFKEAVSNAAKHSGCSSVFILFSCEDSILKLRVTDNGCGFDATTRGDGNGLDSMTRRASALGGQLVITSDDRGTVIEVQTRLPKPGQH